MFEIKYGSDFKRRVKRLSKKYSSLASEIRALGGRLADEPALGAQFAPNCYKIRLAIKSKGKGKSGGARVITMVFVNKEHVYLLDIYDKSEQSSVSKQQLQALVEALGDVDSGPGKDSRE